MRRFEQPGGWRALLPASGRRIRALVLVLLVLPAVYLLRVGNGPPVDFNEDVRPILNRSCIGCHGGVRQAGGFSVQFREEAFAAAKSGRFAIVAGSPDESELIRRIDLPAQDGEHMPKRGAPLTKGEKSILRRWIKEGALWQDYWAYVAPVPQKVPAIQAKDWVSNPIDSFVLARLEQHGRKPAPRANCSQLLRRVSLDLIGLPATFQQVRQFCADPSQAAYERQIDRLLASPQFGERWASPWLDLARYADSIGYEDNWERVIWEYRDWVIRAFNRDLPFDQFTIEQLAGDLLPAPTRDQLIATAYHRNTPSRNDEEEFRLEAVMDRVANTWEVWQGQTMGCARCHSHTYDPFRQTDFYKLMAFFNNTEDADNKGNTPMPGVPQGRALEWPVHYQFQDRHRARGEQLVQERDAARLELLAASTRPDIVASRGRWEAQHRSFRLQNPGFDTARHLSEKTGFDFREIDKIITTNEPARTPNDRRRLADFYALEVAPELAQMRKRWKSLTLKIYALQPVQTPVLRERPDFARRPTHLLVRGGWRRPDLQQPMSPDVPSAMPQLPAEVKRDRLALARWLVDENNPLTARVTVNRYWAELWGLGIVPSVGNFGTQGDLPSNAALLDWLAIEFRTSMRWSVKSLLRMMVASSTYQQSSAAGSAAYDEDPRNQWLARGSRMRLSAEAIRDQALFVAGILDLTQFGPPVVPPSHGEHGAVIAVPSGKPQTDRASPVAGPYRRSVYLRVERKNLYPTFDTFDHSSRFLSVAERGRTNTPLQALTMLNEPVFVAAADALAERMKNASADPVEQIRFGYRQVLLREPDEQEFQALLALYEESISHAGSAGGVRLIPASTAGMSPKPADSHLARRLVANVLLNLDSALTKE